MVPEMKRAFVHAFLRFPDIQFIWKFSRNESDRFENELFSNAPNVHPFEWVEQKAILGKIEWLYFYKLFEAVSNMVSFNNASQFGCNALNSVLSLEIHSAGQNE